jgi:hypothetical protein
MSIIRRLRLFVVLALVLSVAAAWSQGANSNSPPASRDRPSTVVVVRDGGFHWTDAGLGAAAALATTLLAVGLVLALRPDRGANGKP